MDVSRTQLHQHASQTAKILHKSAVTPGISEFGHRTLSDRSAVVDNFVEKLEHTPGATESEIRAASQTRGAERANIGRWAGAIAGGAVVVGTLALGGPFGAALLYGGAALVAGVFGGEKAKDLEQDFQKNLTNFGNEIAQGQPAQATSGIQLNGPVSSGPMTNDEWFMTVASPLTSPLPGIKQTPFG